MTRRIDTQLLKAKLLYRGMTHADAARAIGSSRGTFERRLRNGSFTVKDVHALMEAVPLDMREVKEIFFANEK